ncbi:MAG: VWA domain-containing protein [Spirochaetales bacterium]|nr:VWA domain-containing protein [Spirochaetales bacterium]
MRHKYFLLSLFLFLPVIGFTATFNPVLNKKDIVFEKSDTGYDLYIRKLKEVNSILLTESQRFADPKINNYGLRTEVHYEANSDEIRVLDGKILHTKYDAFFLVDSTPERHPVLGEAFHFFLPEKVIYGYKWSYEGEIKIQPGTRINARLFEKPYSDYSGAFLDQWITLELPMSSATHRNDLVKYAERVANGKTRIIQRNENLADVLNHFITSNVSVSPKNDVVFIIDTTISMKEEFPIFIEIYPELIKRLQKKVKNLRIGFIFFRDYGEEYITKIVPLTDDFNELEQNLRSTNIKGGQDIPEALNEAIYDLEKINFIPDSKRTAFVLTDAPAHPAPKGKITEEMAKDKIKELQIKLNVICLPYR